MIPQICNHLSQVVTYLLLMKFETMDPSRRLFTSASILLLLLFGSSTIARADAVSELASFSIFDKVDLAQLAKSDVKTAHGPPMSNSRFLAVQSCYVAPGAPAQLIGSVAPMESNET